MHEGAEVTHEGLRRALFRWLDRNGDGRYVLRLDERRFAYLDVDDTPLVARAARVGAAGELGGGGARRSHRRRGRRAEPARGGDDRQASAALILTGAPIPQAGQDQVAPSQTQRVGPPFSG